MATNMEAVKRGEFRHAEITQNRDCLYALQQRGYNRFNRNLNPNFYPEPRFCSTATVSKSGIPYRRLLHFLPPFANEVKEFNHIFTHLKEFGRVQPAHLYDGLEFVANFHPYLNTGEIVIGFPALLRQHNTVINSLNPTPANITEAFVPVLIVSDHEIAWDEAPAADGWQTHWYTGVIL